MSLSNGERINFPLRRGFWVRCITIYNNVIEGEISSFVKSRNILSINCYILPLTGPNGNSLKMILKPFITMVNLKRCSEVILICNNLDAKKEETIGPSKVTVKKECDVAALTAQGSSEGVIKGATGSVTAEKQNFGSRMAPGKKGRNLASPTAKGVVTTQVTKGRAVATGTLKGVTDVGVAMSGKDESAGSAAKGVTGAAKTPNVKGLTVATGTGKRVTNLSEKGAANGTNDTKGAAATVKGLIWGATPKNNFKCLSSDTKRIIWQATVIPKCQKPMMPGLFSNSSSKVIQTEKLHIRSKEQLAIQLADYTNPAATPVGRALFKSLARLLNSYNDVCWVDGDIIVLNLSSYRNKQTCMKYVRKIVERFYAENPHFKEPAATNTMHFI